MAVLADIEGICGVHDKRQCTVGSLQWRAARRLISDDVNAAVRGAFLAGADRVLVRDLHGPGFNLLPAMIDPRAEVICGQYAGPPPLLGRLPRLDCALMIGWHAGPDQERAFSPHIFHRMIRRVTVDGSPVTEVELFAAVLGELGVPVVMVTADGPAIARIRGNLPWIETVEIAKTELSEEARARVHEEIAACAARSVRGRDRARMLLRGEHRVEVVTPRGSESWTATSGADAFRRILARSVFRGIPWSLLPLFLALYRLRHRR